jgi:hypothetical protein
MIVINAPEVDEEKTQEVYNFVDAISLSRPKKNIHRDFADGGNSILFKSRFPPH